MITLTSKSKTALERKFRKHVPKGWVFNVVIAGELPVFQGQNLQLRLAGADQSDRVSALVFQSDKAEGQRLIIVLATNPAKDGKPEHSRFLRFVPTAKLYAESWWDPTFTVALQKV